MKPLPPFPAPNVENAAATSTWFPHWLHLTQALGFASIWQGIYAASITHAL